MIDRILVADDEFMIREVLEETIRRHNIEVITASNGDEAKKILAFEVTKIVRGKESAEEALEIAENTFSSKIVDQRLPNISHNETDIKSRLLIAIFKKGFVQTIKILFIKFNMCLHQCFF